MVNVNDNYENSAHTYIHMYLYIQSRVNECCRPNGKSGWRDKKDASTMKFYNGCVRRVQFKSLIKLRFIYACSRRRACVCSIGIYTCSHLCLHAFVCVSMNLSTRLYLCIEAHYTLLLHWMYEQDQRRVENLHTPIKICKGY